MNDMTAIQTNDTTALDSKPTLHLLSAGAAQGVAKAMQGAFEAATGARLSAKFGAVGAMKEALLAGEPCDVMLVTDAMLRALVDGGQVMGEGLLPLGRVRTGVAVCANAARPDVSSPAALAAALRAAGAIYFPDPERATAGIHFAKVMRELGVHDELVPRFRTFPNGATSMREMAAQGDPLAMGCTQVSEIIYTPGVALVAALPTAFELATLYTAGVAANARVPVLAHAFMQVLRGPAMADILASGGFEN